jgi:competence protein ComGF
LICAQEFNLKTFSTELLTLSFHRDQILVQTNTSQDLMIFVVLERVFPTGWATWIERQAKNKLYVKLGEPFSVILRTEAKDERNLWYPSLFNHY